MEQAAKTRILFVVNPKAGTKGNKRLQDAIDRHLDKDRFHYQIAFTSYPGHAAVLVKESIAGGSRIIVAVGGDGSVNDVVSGMIGHPSVQLAILPWGSGNGLARSLGIPFNLKKNLAVLNAGHQRRIDIGQVNGQRFLSNAGTGFDSKVIADFAGSSRRGFLSYLYLIVKHVFRYKARHYEIRTDSETFSGKAFMLTAANGIQLGYGFKIAPDAVPDDGLLDLVIIRALPWYALGGIALRAFLGTLNTSSYLKTIKTRQVTIRRPGMRDYQYDGEKGVCEDVLHIGLLSESLTILVPSETSGQTTDL